MSAIVNTRLLLFWSKNGERNAALARDFMPRFSHPNNFPCVPFAITRHGVRDAPSRMIATGNGGSSSISHTSAIPLPTYTTTEPGDDHELHMAPSATHKLSRNAVMSLPFEYEVPQGPENLLAGEVEQAMREEETLESAALGEQVPPPLAPLPAQKPQPAVGPRNPANVYSDVTWTGSPDSRAKRNAQEVYGDAPAQESAAQRKRTN